MPPLYTEEYKNQLKQQLMVNIALIQQVIPGFSMSNEQIEELLSEKRLNAHMKAMAGRKPEPEEGMPSADEMKALDQIPGNIKVPVMGRAYGFMVSDDDKATKQLFEHLGRDDDIGVEARKNYLKEFINNSFRLDPEKYPELKNDPEQLIDFAQKHYNQGKVVQDILATHNNQKELEFTGEGKKKYDRMLDPATGFASFVTEYADLMADPDYITFPVKFLTEEQFMTLQNNPQLFQDKKVLGFKDRSRALENAERSADQLTRAQKDTEPFTADDYATVPGAVTYGGLDGYINALQHSFDGLSELFDAAGPELEPLKNQLQELKLTVDHGRYYPTEKQLNELAGKLKSASSSIRAALKDGSLKESRSELAGKLEDFRKLLDHGARENFLTLQEKIRDYDFQIVPETGRLFKELKRLDNKLLTPEDINRLRGSIFTILYGLENKMAGSENAFGSPTSKKRAQKEAAHLSAMFRSTLQAKPGMYLRECLKTPEPGPFKYESIAGMKANLLHTGQAPFNSVGIVDLLAGTLNEQKLENAPQSFEALRKDFQVLQLTLNQQLSEGDDNYDSKTAEKLAGMLDSVADKCDALASGSPSPGFEKTHVALKYGTAPLRNASRLLKEGKISHISKAFADQSWVSGLFNRGGKLGEPEGFDFNYNPEEHTLQENMDEYARSSDILKNQAMKRLVSVTGDKDFPVEAMQFKLQMMEAGLNNVDWGCNIPEREGIRSFRENFSQALDSFDLKKLNHKNPLNLLINSGNMDHLFDRLASPESSSQAIKGSGMPREVKEIYSEALSGLKFKGSNLEIEAQLKHMDKLTGFMNTFERINGALYDALYTVDGTDSKRNPVTDPDDPWHDMYYSVDHTIGVCYEYLRGEKSIEDIQNAKAEMVDSIRRFIETGEMFREDQVNGPQLLEHFSNIQAHIIPILKTMKPDGENDAKLLEDCLKERSRKEFAKLLEEYVLTDDEVRNNRYVKLKELCDYSPLPDRAFETVEHLRMLQELDSVDNTTGETEPGFSTISGNRAKAAIQDFINNNGPQNSQKFRLNDRMDMGKKRPAQDVYKDAYRTLFVSELMKNFLEEIRIWDSRVSDIDVTGNDYDFANDIRHGTPPGFYEVLSTIRVKENLPKMVGWINGALNTDGIKDLMEKSPAEINELIQNGTLRDTLKTAIFGRDLTAGIKDETINNLHKISRDAGIFHFKNSPEYEAIRNSFDELENVKTQPGKFNEKNQVCRKLYYACRNYVNNRDAVPSGDAGKERFKAAADVLLNLGKELYETNPEMRESIEEDFKVTAVRSKEFRDNLIEKNVTKELTDFGKNFRDAYAKRGKTQESAVPSGLAARRKLVTAAENMISFDRAGQLLDDGITAAREKMAEALKNQDSKQLIESVSVVIHNSRMKALMQKPENAQLITGHVLDGQAMAGAAESFKKMAELQFNRMTPELKNAVFASNDIAKVEKLFSAGVDNQLLSKDRAKKSTASPKEKTSSMKK